MLNPLQNLPTRVHFPEPWNSWVFVCLHVCFPVGETLFQWEMYIICGRIGQLGTDSSISEVGLFPPGFKQVQFSPLNSSKISLDPQFPVSICPVSFHLQPIFLKALSYYLHLSALSSLNLSSTATASLLQRNGSCHDPQWPLTHWIWWLLIRLHLPWIHHLSLKSSSLVAYLSEWPHQPSS